MEQVIPGEKMIPVMQVINRPEKDDCRAGTNIVWKGQGNIQNYPLRLWHKLEPHPDVWRRMDVSASGAPHVPRLFGGHKKAAPGLGAAEKPTGFLAIDPRFGFAVVDENDLADVKDEEIHAEARKRNYDLHPRLNPLNLRVKFLEAQQAFINNATHESA